MNQKPNIQITCDNCFSVFYDPLKEINDKRIETNVATKHTNSRSKSVRSVYGPDGSAEFSIRRWVFRVPGIMVFYVFFFFSEARACVNDVF